jgi:hypothetical protein
MPPPQLIPLKRSTRDVPDDEEQHWTVTPMRGDRYENSGLAGDEASRSRMTIESSGKRHKWIDDIVKVRLTIVLHELQLTRTESEYWRHAI